MDVYNVGVEPACFDDSQKSVDDGFEAFAARRVDVDEADAFVLVAAVFGGDVATAANDGYVDTHIADARKEFFTVGFDATENVGNSSSAGYYNFHRC